MQLLGFQLTSCDKLSSNSAYEETSSKRYTKNAPQLRKAYNQN